MPPDTSLSGLRVLVTRAQDDAASLRALLEARGASVAELPAVAIEEPEDSRQLEEALGRLSNYDWIVFTSRNAVRAVVRRLPPLSELPALPSVAAVGPATAAELEAHGFPVDFVSAEATGEALAAALVYGDVSGARILLPVGDLARPAVRQRLEAAGAQVDEIVVYRTVRPSEVDSTALDLLRRGQIDVVALLSPSAIRNLAEMLGSEASCLQQTRLVCIGPTTAAAARELGLEPAAVADPHTLDGLLHAIASLRAQEELHEPV